MRFRRFGVAGSGHAYVKAVGGLHTRFVRSMRDGANPEGDPQTLLVLSVRDGAKAKEAHALSIKTQEGPRVGDLSFEG